MLGWTLANVMLLAVILLAWQLHKARKATASLALCIIQLSDDVRRIERESGTRRNEGWPTDDMAVTVLDQIGTADDIDQAWYVFERSVLPNLLDRSQFRGGNR